MEAKVEPVIWAITYAKPFTMLMWPVSIVAKVTHLRGAAIDGQLAEVLMFSRDCQVLLFGTGGGYAQVCARVEVTTTDVGRYIDCAQATLVSDSTICHHVHIVYSGCRLSELINSQTVRKTHVM